MHGHLDELKDLGISTYIISNDIPENQLELYVQLEEFFGESLPFVSDQDLKLVDHMDMKNGDTAYRGSALIDGDGTLIFNRVNDYWGDQAEKSISELKEELEKLTK